MTTETLSAFKKFDKENPTVYRKFTAKTKQVWKLGRRRYSAWAVINEVRWEYFKTTGNKYKISNDFIALYARKFMKENAKYKTFFTIKPLKIK